MEWNGLAESTKLCACPNMIWDGGSRILEYKRRMRIHVEVSRDDEDIGMIHIFPKPHTDVSPHFACWCASEDWSEVSLLLKLLRR